MSNLRVHVAGHRAITPVLTNIATATGLQVVPTLRRAEVVVRCHNGSPGALMTPADLDEIPRCDVTVGELGGVQHVRVGPLNVPGSTACPGCVAAHELDAGRIRRLGSVAHPSDHLVWAACTLTVRELMVLDRLFDDPEAVLPVSWKAAILLGPRDLPVELPLTRHSRCGCAWADFMEA